MAKYKPGETGNKQGRPKGSKNKVQAFTKLEISDFLTKYWPQIRRDFMKMEPAQRVQTFLKLISFVIPRPTEGNFNMTFNPENLSDNDIDQILNTLISNSYEN